uniref:Uncharacterized protein n=1 Tax=Triticum urartu TaxID=4572 RepID=A0A8R7TNU8_TRIUA
STARYKRGGRALGQRTYIRANTQLLLTVNPKRVLQGIRRPLPPPTTSSSVPAASCFHQRLLVAALLPRPSPCCCWRSQGAATGYTGGFIEWPWGFAKHCKFVRFRPHNAGVLVRD